MSDPVEVAAKPVRIQLKRTKGWRMPENTVKVDRTTKWGNPFFITSRHPIEVKGSVDYFRRWLSGEAGLGMPADLGVALAEAVHQLRGKNLACWCPHDGLPCHADVLLELANADLAGGGT